MRPIPHNQTEGEDADERVRLTTRQSSEDEPEDDEAWIAVQEF